MKSISLLLLVLTLAVAGWAQGRQRGGVLPRPGQQDRPNRGTDRMPPQVREAPRPAPQPKTQPQSTPPPPQKLQPQGAPPQATQPQPGQAQPDPGAQQRSGGQRFGDWLRDHQKLPMDQQMKLLEQERAFQQLSPQEQQRLRQRLQRFSSLPPEQRERRLEHLQRLEQLTPEQRRRAEGILDNFRGLPEDRRLLIGRAAGFLSRMNPQQQQRVLDSPRMRNQFSDQERDILRGVLDLQIGPASPPRDSSQRPEE